MKNAVVSNHDVLDQKEINLQQDRIAVATIIVRIARMATDSVDLEIHGAESIVLGETPRISMSTRKESRHGEWRKRECTIAPKYPPAGGTQSPLIERSLDWPCPPGWLDVLMLHWGLPPPMKREIPQRELSPASFWGAARPTVAREARMAIGTA